MNSDVLIDRIAQSEFVDMNDEMLNRIGQVTRSLHESLRSLGLDKIIEHVAKDIPDACERLNYVSRMTEQAAERVLNATDLAIPLQTEITTNSQALKKYWEDVIQTHSLKSDYNESVEKTLVFLKLTEQHSLETKALLMEIMMAQDFQDLTGQVIKKVIGLTRDLESQLIQVLVDFSPVLNTKATTPKGNLINGPQVSNNSIDSLSNQQDVDDLLNDLGF